MPLPQSAAAVRSWVVNVSSPASSAERNGGPLQLEPLFCAHFERVARVIGRVIHDEARAEEIAVEVFLKWSRTPRAQGEGAAGWLYRTAAREALDELRRQSRRERFERLVGAFRRTPPTPEQLCQAEIEQRQVRTVLAALPPRLATLLLLWSEDASYRDLAAAVDIRLNYVGSLLHRAQETFRQEFEKRYGTRS